MPLSLWAGSFGAKTTGGGTNLMKRKSKPKETVITASFITDPDHPEKTLPGAVVELAVPTVFVAVDGRTFIPIGSTADGNTVLFQEVRKFMEESIAKLEGQTSFGA